MMQLIYILIFQIEKSNVFIIWRGLLAYVILMSIWFNFHFLTLHVCHTICIKLYLLLSHSLAIHARSNFFIFFFRPFSKHKIITLSCILFILFWYIFVNANKPFQFIFFFISQKAKFCVHHKMFPFFSEASRKEVCGRQ